MKYAIPIGVLIFFAGVVAAQNNPVAFDEARFGRGNLGEPISNVIDTNISATSDPGTGQIYNVTYFNRADTNFPIVNTTVRLQLQYHAAWQQQQGGAGIYGLTVFHNEDLIPNCDFEIETLNPGVLGGQPRADVSMQIFCLIVEPTFGVNNISVQRLVSSGTPSAIEQEIISHELKRQDLVIVNDQTLLVDGTSTLNLLALLVFVMVAWFLWSRTEDIAVRLMMVSFIFIGFFAALAQRADWEHMIWVAILIGLFGAYMGFRTGVKAIETRRISD